MKKLKHHLYILHIAAQTNEQEFIGPFKSEILRVARIRELNQTLNSKLIDPRVRSRFYRANIADDILTEVLQDIQEAA